VGNLHLNPRLYILALSWVVAGLFAPSGLAQTSATASGELTIEGDSAVFMQEENRIEYSGNVVAFMDGLQITGDSVSVQMDNDRIAQITTQGAPANFRQETEGTDQATTASASTITFLPQSSILELTGSASLRQAGNTVNGTTIRYDLAQGKLVANGNQSATGRVRVQLKVPSQTPAQRGDQP